ncbi:MAG: hypothetical protein F3745_07480 [Nitrospinae bacterium]|nr:hypothetical protein [Nitrospinota bacterium]
MKIIALIPARMESSRFPGKPMASILGKPMIGHVYERVSKNSMLALTVVATCNEEIADYIESIGGRAIMTGKHHERASDRCAEALNIIEEQDNEKYDVVVMVQGDLRLGTLAEVPERADGGEFWILVHVGLGT